MKREAREDYERWQRAAPFVLSLRIDGVPQPKGSAMALPVDRDGGRRGARIVLKHSKGAKTWDKTVKETVRDYLLDVVSVPVIPVFGPRVPVNLELTFYVPRPAGVKDRVYPAVIPDGDKLERLVADACRGLLWADDAQIIDSRRRLRYADDLNGPGVLITATTMPLSH